MFRHEWEALPLYLLLEAASALLFQLVGTIYVVFYAQTVGLNAFEIVLMGTVFETTIFLFEIPTGVVADLYSRRLSVILGVILTGAGLMIAGLFPLIAVILLQEIITGIGATFLSGATEAWIADEIGEANAGRAFVRAGQVRQVGGMVGIVLSVALASADLRLPFVAAGGLFLLLALTLIAFMPERGFHPTPKAERSTWRSLIGTLRAGIRLIRQRAALGVIVAVAFVAAFQSEGFDHLWQKHVLDDFTLPALGSLDPVVWFGVMSLGATLLSLALSEVIRRRVDLARQQSTVRALLLIYAVQPIGILVFSLTGHFAAALIAYWLIMALRWSGDPLMKAWINQNVQPQIRATVFSLTGQVGALGEIVGGPPVGALAQLVSLRVALASCGAILALTLPLFGAALRPTTTSRVE